MISFRSISLTCAILTLLAMPAFCTPVLYTDSTSWQNAVTGPSTVTFAVGNYNNSTGFTTGLALPDNPTFLGMLQMANGSNPNCWSTSPGNCSLQVLDHNASQYFNYGNVNPLAWGAYSSSNVLSSSLHVTFPTAISAFGLNLMTYGGNGVSYNVKLNGDPTQVFTSNPTTGYPTPTFFGLVSTTPITSIDFYLPTTTSAAPMLNQFSYVPNNASTGNSSPSDIPEPGICLLIATGLIGLALMGRRSRRAAAAQA